MLRSQRIIAMNIQPKITPVLDPGFVPAVLWNQAFEAKAAADPASHQVDIALTRNDGTCFRWSGKLLPHTGENIALNETYVERIVKFLLWQKGGNIILVAGDDAIADMLASRYCKGGIREFVRWYNRHKTPIHEQVIYMSGSKGDDTAEVALQYNDSFNSNIVSFANDIHTPEEIGRAHV